MISKNLIKLIKSLEQKKYRKREKLFVAEGPKVVGDLMALMAPQRIIATSEWYKGKQVSEDVVVTEDEIRKVSFLQHPQGVLGIFKTPAIPQPTMNKKKLMLALDGVQDPGNLGTIIRIADWFGISEVVCSIDTADCWAPKVVQATMGSIARVHIIYKDLCELLDEADKQGVSVYGTLLDGRNIYEEELSEGGIIVMGNEGNGISLPLRERIKRKLFIPDFHQGRTADSLNVAIATAITCSEFRRRGSGGQPR